MAQLNTLYKFMKLFFLRRGLKQVTGGAAGLPGRGAAGRTWRVTDGLCLACSCHFSFYFTAWDSSAMPREGSAMLAASSPPLPVPGS